jgi:RecB family exonuclease
VPALVLVPSAVHAARAARRLCDAEGGILFGPPVSGLDRVAGEILAAAGDRRPVLSPLAEKLVALEAAHAAGGPLANAAPDAGLGRAAAGAIAELRRGEVTAEAVRSAVASLDGGPAERLAVLGEALAAYEARLRDLEALDAPAALREAAAALRRGARPAELRALDLLVLDGFAALAPAEWELVAALLAIARRSRVHLPFFPERAALCAPAEPLLRRLEAQHALAAERDVEVALGRVAEGRAGRPAALLAAFPASPNPPLQETWREGRSEGGDLGDGEVIVAAGAGEDGEAGVVAALVADLLGRGFGCEDVVVVAPAPRRAAPALAAAFAAAGIPFASGRGTALGDAPVVAAIREALRAAVEGGLDRRGAERVAASTYLAPRDLPARLGALLERAGALDGRLAPAAALRRRADSLGASAAERGGLLRAAAALDGFEDALRPLAGAAPARVHAARLAAFVDGAGIRRRAARAEPAVAARDLAALARLDEASDAVTRARALAGRAAEALTPAAWRALLDLAIDGATLPPAGEPAAGAVELWGVDEAHGLSARAVVLTGCARGSWPAPLPPEPLLREPERLAVNRIVRRAALATGGARRAEAAHALFSAAAAGREVVAFTWPAPGPAGGGPLAPLAQEALAAVGLVPPPGPVPEPELGRARTVRAALRAAARLARAERTEAARAALAGTPLAPRADAVFARGAVEMERRSAVQARKATPFAGRVEGEALAALEARLPAEWSPTQLESYAGCPFRAFLRLGLALEEPERADLELDGRDEGSVLHAILERFVAGRLTPQPPSHRIEPSWPPVPGPALAAEVRAVAGEVFARFARDGRVGDPAVWAARREALLGRVLRALEAEARDSGGLAPVQVEHRFGGENGTPPLAVEADGETVLLRGRIDRVDASPDRLLVLDYKGGRNDARYAPLLDPETFGETSFQVPAYLLAAARDLPGRTSHGATYLMLGSAERLDAVALGAGDAEAFASRTVALVRRLRGGEFPIASRDCKGCPHGAVCRFEGVAAATDAEEAA